MWLKRTQIKIRDSTLRNNDNRAKPNRASQCFVIVLTGTRNHSPKFILHVWIWEPRSKLVRILSAMVQLVYIQYFSTLRRARNNFLQPPTCRVRFKALKLRQKSKIADKKKRVLPNARCLVDVAVRKLGSRMDALIFDFRGATIPDPILMCIPLEIRY